MADLTKTRITAREFYKMYGETNEQIELIGGEVIVSPAPKDLHQKIHLKLTLLLGPILDESLGELRTPPSDLHFSETDVVQPDFFFVLKENTRCQLGEDGYWYGAPDLCIEILSPGTRKRDKVTKYELYRKNGVREYWIVDPLDSLIEVYVLDGDTYRREGAYDENSKLKSPTIPQIEIEVSRVFPF